MATMPKPRDVHYYKPTWMDRQFAKALKKLDAKQRQKCLQWLELLTKALAVCTHPRNDPRLASFDPSPYDRVIKVKDLYEYRKGNRVRAVACVRSEWALLLTVTVSHDHERMQRLLQQHRTEIATWRPRGA